MPQSGVETLIANQKNLKLIQTASHRQQVTAKSPPI